MYSMLVLHKYLEFWSGHGSTANNGSVKWFYYMHAGIVLKVTSMHENYLSCCYLYPFFPYSGPASAIVICYKWVSQYITASRKLWCSKYSNRMVSDCSVKQYAVISFTNALMICFNYRTLNNFIIVVNWSAVAYVS